MSNNSDWACVTEDVDVAPTRKRLALQKGKFWDNGTALNVCFLSGGNDAIHRKIEENAQLWSDRSDGANANVKLRFTRDGLPLWYVTRQPWSPKEAHIRIKIDDSNRSWSKLGTDTAATTDTASQTMNFGWFNDETSAEEFMRTTVHEFGHALGCIHEHLSPNSTLDWISDRTSIYDEYLKNQKWDKATVDHNVFNVIAADDALASDFDPLSIMMYMLPAKYFKNKQGTNLNTSLSITDKDFIACIYPKQVRSIPSTQYDVKQEHMERGENSWPAKSAFKAFDFRPRYMFKPRIALGIYEALHGEGPSYGMNAYAQLEAEDRIVDHYDRMIIHVDPVRQSNLVSGACTWLEFGKYQAAFATGTVSFQLNRSDIVQNTEVVHRQEVWARENGAPFKNPTVVTWIQQFDFPKDANVMMSSEVEKVENSGSTTKITLKSTFLLLFDHPILASDDLQVSMKVCWVCFSTDKEGVCGGNLSFDDDHWADKYKKGQVAKFPTGKFEFPPDVFMAINKIAVTAPLRLSFKVDSYNIKKDQFEWRVMNFNNQQKFENFGLPYSMDWSKRVGGIGYIALADNFVDKDLAKTAEGLYEDVRYDT